MMGDQPSFMQRIAERQKKDVVRPIAKYVAPAPTAVPPAGLEAARQRKYAEAALQREASALAAMAPNSGRNTALNRARFNVERFVDEGILDRDYVDDTLTAAARQSGLSDPETRQTIRSAVRGSATKVRDQPAVPPPSPEYIPRVTEVTRDSVIGAPPTPIGDTNTTTGTPIDAEIHPIWGHHPPSPGGGYLFDHEDTQVAIWGNSEHILWAEGEALMIAGGMGLGKTTLAGQILRGQLGLETEVLNLPVLATDKPILYLAMDRPRQIRRSMLRQFDPSEREYLQSLLIRPGPPVADIAVRPTLLAEMAEECGAGTIYIDSLKDAAIGLSTDEVGAIYNRARQYALAQGVQLCELHHLVKRNALGGTPNSVADIYGSNWLAAGAGSIIMLTGEPGDPIVGFQHVKQPFEEVGPFKIAHDQGAGRFTIEHGLDLVELAADFGPEGIKAHQAAVAMFDKDKPSSGQVEKARRKLDKLVEMGKLTRVDGMRGRGSASTYFAH